MKQGLKEGIKQFIISGTLCEKNSILIPATDNYFKALIHSVDFFLLDIIGKIPDNHTERFRILERENKELYSLVDELFKLYRKSYRESITKEEFLRVKNGLIKTLKLTNLEKEFIKHL